ncbi:hypothetical protein C8R44DRAFT_606765, partial [Mycena epipterygia]
MSLVFILSARALRRAVCVSFWSPPRGVSTIDSGSSCTFTPTLPPDIFPVAIFPPPPSQIASPLPSLPTPPLLFLSSPPDALHPSTPIFRAPTPTHPTMPARKDRTAPVFDSRNARDLRQYFSDLEFLFSRSSIAADSEKKFHATRFLSIDDQDLWESVPEFTDPAASFEQFTAAIFRLYPEADPDRRYSIADLNALVTELSHVQSLNHPRFLEFYRRFFTISTFLRAKDRLSVFEQSRYFCHAIPPNIWSLVHHRLRIKSPDVHPDDPYLLTDLRDAVDFVLIASTSSSSTPALPTPELPTSVPASLSADSSIAALLNAVKQLGHLVSLQQPSPATFNLDSQPTSPRTTPPSPRPFACSYCSDSAHFIARCPLVTADIRAGHCRHNAEGKVVLPSGLFVPHRITGPNIRARISYWHREN